MAGTAPVCRVQDAMRSHWDGRDAAGQLVRPGVYLARVEVETDQGRAVRLQPVAVIY